MRVRAWRFTENEKILEKKQIIAEEYLTSVYKYT